MSAGSPETWDVGPLGPLQGSLQVPGDKSISHRALMFNALATGERARLHGVLDSGDATATMGAMTAMGASIDRMATQGSWMVSGPLRAPDGPIDCGNSGTSIRLLAGIAASMPWTTVLDGDQSLRRRPMSRVTDPLRQMGARIDGDGRLPPLTIHGGDLTPIRYDSPLSSAQVKSCLLLAGLRGGVSFREPRRSRDHTERMLRAMGAELHEAADGWLTLAPTARLAPLDVSVPGDVSAAAFWLVGGSIVPGSRLLLGNVGMNPTRTGVVDALVAMGADIEVGCDIGAGVEPAADIAVNACGLKGTRIDGELALRCLDELPVLAVAAAYAEGETVIADAGELRVKESDRIARTVAGLRSLGVEVEERPDGMVIEGRAGEPLEADAHVDATGDHRIAMAFSVAALAGKGVVTIAGAESVRSSYPAFRTHLEHLCRG